MYVLNRDGAWKYGKFVLNMKAADIVDEYVMFIFLFLGLDGDFCKYKLIL